MLINFHSSQCDYLVLNIIGADVRELGIFLL